MFSCVYPTLITGFLLFLYSLADMTKALKCGYLLRYKRKWCFLYFFLLPLSTTIAFARLSEFKQGSKKPNVYLLCCHQHVPHTFCSLYIKQSLYCIVELPRGNIPHKVLRIVLWRTTILYSIKGTQVT